MAKKVIYFTAGTTATTQELADIVELNTRIGYNVFVRNGADNASFGSGIESCDLVAGTVPTAFNAKPIYGTIDPLKPCLFTILSTVTLAALATKQLYPIAVIGTDLSNLAASDLTANVTYASSDATKATVSSGGLITAVATGTAAITATYTYTSGKTVTATCAVTVS